MEAIMDESTPIGCVPIKEKLNKPENIAAIQVMNEHLVDFRREYRRKNFASIQESKKVTLYG
jgi:hypothetical protein